MNAAFQATVALAIQHALPNIEPPAPLTYGDVILHFKLQRLDAMLRARAVRHFDAAIAGGVVLQ